VPQYPPKGGIIALSFACAAASHCMSEWPRRGTSMPKLGAKDACRAGVGRNRLAIGANRAEPSAAHAIAAANVTRRRPRCGSSDKVYVAAVMILLAILREWAMPIQMRWLTELIGLDQHTVESWRARRRFVVTTAPFWRNLHAAGRSERWRAAALRARDAAN
jgi:hypothetical protein